MTIPEPSGDIDDIDEVLRRRAIGAGLAMLVIVLSYGASGLGDPDRWWASGVAIAVGVLSADALIDLRAALPIPGLAPAALVGALFIVFLCVPETDQLPVVALLPGALVFLEVVSRRQFPLEWYAIASAAIGWGALYGATGRQSALVGGLFAWWIVLLPAVAHSMRPLVPLWKAVVATVVAGIAGAVFARTGGLSDRNAEIVIALVGCAVVSIVIVMGLARLDDGSSSEEAVDRDVS